MVILAPTRGHRRGLREKTSPARAVRERCPGTVWLYSLPLVVTGAVCAKRLRRRVLFASAAQAPYGYTRSHSWSPARSARKDFAGACCSRALPRHRMVILAPTRGHRRGLREKTSPARAVRERC